MFKCNLLKTALISIFLGAALLTACGSEKEKSDKTDIVTPAVTEPVKDPVKEPDSESPVPTSTEVTEAPTQAPTEPVVLNPDDESLYVWDGTVITGLTDNGKNQTELVIPEKCTGINATAATEKGFRYSKVENLTIGENVESIDFRTFMYCDNLKSVTINTKDEVYNDWFYGDDMIEELFFPEGMRKIGTGLNIQGIKKVVIPSTVNEIPNCLFGFDMKGEKLTDGVEVYTTGDNIMQWGDYDRSTIEEITGTSNDDSYNKQILETLQMLLAPNYVGQLASFNDNFVPVTLYCDKDSLWDIIFSSASWVTVIYN